MTTKPNLASVLAAKRVADATNPDKQVQNQPTLGASSNAKRSYHQTPPTENSNQPNNTNNNKKTPVNTARNDKQLQINVLDKKMNEIQQEQDRKTNEAMDAWKGFDTVNYGFSDPAPTQPPKPEKVKTPPQQATPVREPTPVKTPPRQATPVREPTPKKTPPRQATPVREPTPEKTPPRQATPVREPTPVKTPPRQATPVREPTPEKTPPRQATPAREPTPTRYPTPPKTPERELTPIEYQPTEKVLSPNEPYVEKIETPRQQTPEKALPSPIVQQETQPIVVTRKPSIPIIRPATSKTNERPPTTKSVRFEPQPNENIAARIEITPTPVTLPILQPPRPNFIPERVSERTYHPSASANSNNRTYELNLFAFPHPSIRRSSASAGITLPNIPSYDTKPMTNAGKSIQRSMDRYRFHVW